MRGLAWCAVAAAVAVAGCQKPVDRAAKQRIFSAEDPPQVVASATEALAPEQLGDDSRSAARVLGMSDAEVTERLGPHRFEAEVSFDWSAGTGKVRLAETRLLEAGRGGVGGDFHAQLDNSRDQGLEVFRAAGQVYARNRYGHFRLRQRDRGMAERTREDVGGALREVMGLFGERARLVAQGQVAYEGRSAYRYQVQLGAPVQAASAHIPPLAPPKGGLDETTRRRAAFFGRRQPRALDGELLVDGATSVVLRARIDGRLDVPAQPGAAPASLHVTLAQKLLHIGQDPRLRPPAGFLPDVDKPEGIAGALDRFGIPRSNAPDAGVDAEDDG